MIISRSISQFITRVIVYVFLITMGASHWAEPVRAQGGNLPGPEKMLYYPSGARYDSGWVIINPGQAITLAHNLGGSVNNYIVDLRFFSASISYASYGYNQAMYGGNDLAAPVPAGYEVGDEVGAYWSNLTTSTVKVTRRADDVAYVVKIRVRIWMEPDSDYDSGWFDIGQNAYITKTHSLGGDPDDFLVYLEFKDISQLNPYGINQRYYGGFTNALGNGVGGHWRNLTSSTIGLFRKASDITADQMRVRIWKRLNPSYDSGWMNLSAGWHMTFHHNLGGNPNDYIVDMQFKDTDNGRGTNQICYGSCDNYNTSSEPEPKQGAYWRWLTQDTINVMRAPDDLFVDQVRIRIWNFWTPSAPNFNSGWRTSPVISVVTVPHNLGGSADDYLVHLDFHDTSLMTHQLYYGGKTFGASPPGGYSENNSAGAHWNRLTNNSVSVYRLDHDNSVDQWRVRIWKMPKPDYDSGWVAINAGSARTLSHGLVGDRNDFLVDVSFNDLTQTYGKNQMYFGGRVTSGNLYVGAHWHSFQTETGNATITVYRWPDHGEYVDQVRVRIWRVNRPDYESGYQTYTQGQIRLNSHLLGSADDLLVDVTANQTSGDHKAFYGRVDVGTESPFPSNTENDRVGFLWWNLSNSHIVVKRLEEDDTATSINTRIWRIPPPNIYLPLIFR